MLKILVLVDYYLPGYKSGGPVRSIANMVEAIGDHFEFLLITRDRDATDSEPFATVQVDAWNQVGKASVFYASPQSLSYNRLLRLVREVAPDAVYLNSFFSQMTRRYLLLRKLGRIDRKIATIIAPRGEFSPGALQLKSIKKQLYIFGAKHLALYDNLLWQASSEQERDEITQGWSAAMEIVVAPNLPDMAQNRDQLARICSKTKKAGEARFIFVSRITPKKNLAFALELLQHVTGKVEFDIYGPVRDEAYWEKCQQQINRLSGNIAVQYHGSIPHEEVFAAFRQSHFFLFPTLGENYGHVILEAIAAGCPVLTSDQTFWRNLQKKGVGWDISLENNDKWVQTVQLCIDMNEEEYSNMSLQAQRFHQEWISSDAILQPNVELFERVIQK